MVQAMRDSGMSNNEIHFALISQLAHERRQLIASSFDDFILMEEDDSDDSDSVGESSDEIDLGAH